MKQSRRTFFQGSAASLAVLAVMIGQPGGSWAESADGVISAPDAFTASQDGSVILIDIRSPSEWDQTGIPQGAHAVTMHDDGGPAAFLDNIRKTVDGDTSAPIALICARGVRTKWAQRFLTSNGFTNVLNVSEGMFGRGSNPGWLKRDLPVSSWQKQE